MKLAAQTQIFSPDQIHLPSTPTLISRPRLLHHLKTSLHHKLILVCAGPGYGKTALLADFARHARGPICQHVLEIADRQPGYFLGHLVTAIRKHFPPLGEQARDRLEQPGHEHWARWAAAAALARDLAQAPGEVVLVLDDYHVVAEVPAIDELLDVLLRCLPENAHLVLSRRTGPSLTLLNPLAYGGMGVVRADLLNFTTEEMIGVFQQDACSPVGEEEAAILAAESEGWIQGALLLAQAGHGTEDFCADGRRTRPALLDDYLCAQVLSACAPDMQEFLTRVCVFEEMDGALCDALLERQDSAQVLSFLERHNLLLVSLGAGWYRFHRLLRAFLLGEARRSHRQFADLQRRAGSLWRQQGPVVSVVRQLRFGEKGPHPSQKLIPPLAEHTMLRQVTRGSARALPEKGEETEQEEAGSLSGNSLPPRPVLPVLSSEAVEEAQETARENLNPVASPPLLLIRGFGPGQVWREGREVLTEEWKYDKPLELFFYHLENPGASREQIKAALWPDAGEKNLDSSLYSAASQAYRVIGRRFVAPRGKRYRWHPTLPYRYDVADFEDLLARAERRPVRDPQGITLFEQAIALYHGDFLISLNTEWVLTRREELANQYQRALLRLGQFYLERRDIRAQTYYEQALRADAYQEEALAGLMRCCALVGERSRAIRLYQECCQRFQKELHANPSAAIHALYQDILKDDLW